MVETQQKPQITKRAKWEKIKKELLKLPKKVPEIIGIAIYVQDDAIILITEPIGVTYELTLFGIGRSLQNKVNINFSHFDIINMGSFSKETSWKEMIPAGAKTIYERAWDGR